jgi:hypothetical protein
MNSADKFGELDMRTLLSSHLNGLALDFPMGGELRHEFRELRSHGIDFVRRYRTLCDEALVSALY